MKRITNITYPALALFTLAGFALLPQARATCQQGCLQNNNTVLGDSALVNNTTGNNNTATGYFALFASATGFDNTATGSGALADDTSGESNTATGTNALGFNSTGNDNTATGSGALINNSTGQANTAVGDAALATNTTGSSNIALGSAAGLNLATGSNNIYIGNFGGGGNESATIRIGTTGTHTQTSVAGIYGATVPRGVGVIIGTNGKLGTVVSSERFKEAIKPMDKASEAILALKPVAFRYKKELDPEAIPHFGLVAEQVEKVNPDLVARDEQGKPYTVRYEAVNAMLLNEFLKEHKKVEEQQAAIADLKSTVAQQQKGFQSKLAKQEKQIEALTAGLQKVSAQVELNKRAPETVVANQ
jgi:hypothetical protein